MDISAIKGRVTEMGNSVLSYFKDKFRDKYQSIKESLRMRTYSNNALFKMATEARQDYNRANKENQNLISTLNKVKEENSKLETSISILSGKITSLEDDVDALTRNRASLEESLGEYKQGELNSPAYLELQRKYQDSLILIEKVIKEKDEAVVDLNKKLNLANSTIQYTGDMLAKNRAKRRAEAGLVEQIRTKGVEPTLDLLEFQNKYYKKSLLGRPVILVNSKGKVVSCTSVVYKMGFGQNIIGEDVYKILTTDPKEQLKKEDVKKYFNTREPVDFEATVVLNNRPFNLHVYKFPACLYKRLDLTGIRDKNIDAVAYVPVVLEKVLWVDKNKKLSTLMKDKEMFYRLITVHKIEGVDRLIDKMGIKKLRRMYYELESKLERTD